MWEMVVTGTVMKSNSTANVVLNHVNHVLLVHIHRDKRSAQERRRAMFVYRLDVFGMAICVLLQRVLNVLLDL